MGKNKRHPAIPAATKPGNWKAAAAAHLHAVFVHHWRHWAIAVGLILLGSLFSHYLELSPTLFDLRYRLYRYVQNPSAIQPFFRDVVVVTIDDDEYWHGELARRVPIKRRYLAKLVTELAKGEPSVIALDFDFRSLDPSGQSKATTCDGTITLPDHQDYVDETADLLIAIRSLPEGVAVVLPKTIHQDEEGYFEESDIYDGFKFDREVGNGFISLSDDIRHIPRILTLKDGKPLDSLSIAVVRAFRSDVLTKKDWHEKMSGSFIPREEDNELRASRVLQGTKESRQVVKKKVQDRVVLVGANWHLQGFGRGRLADSYSTPVGTLPGVFIHANYVQAILDGRSFELFRWNTLVEWCFGLALTYVTALPMKWQWKTGFFLIVFALPFGASYIALQNWGVYCDVGIVYTLLLAHLLVERLLK